MELDPTSAERKLAHIDLTIEAQIPAALKDNRFNYEPLFHAHPALGEGPVKKTFLGRELKAPLWISSMTGGTGPARHINQNLARGVGEFGLGMGLGSCRSLLDDDTYFEDFNMRPLIGAQPLYANLGIAQVEQLLLANSWGKVESMVAKLKADGLIIHLNPMQEWFQKEGDLLKRSPLESIEEALFKKSFPIIVKEVGQGMGPKSLEALMLSDLEAIEFGAFGGTNFSRLEQLRLKESGKNSFRELALIGHSAEEMVGFVNKVISEKKELVKCKQFIISGGVQNALHGYHLINSCHGESIYGQAKAMLVAARGDYESFQRFLSAQLSGLAMSERFLTIGDKLQ